MWGEPGNWEIGNAAATTVSTRPTTSPEHGHRDKKGANAAAREPTQLEASPTSAPTKPAFNSYQSGTKTWDRNLTHE